MTKKTGSLKTLKRWLRPIKRCLSSLIEIKAGILLTRVVEGNASSDAGYLAARQGVVKKASQKGELPLTSEEFQRRSRQGNDLYQLVVDDKVLSHGWVARPGTRIGVLHELSLTVPAHAFYIWDCATAPAFRGQGYFPSLLEGIVSAHHPALSLALVAVDSRNEASRKALVKAGFRPEFTYLSVRSLGFVLFSLVIKGRKLTGAQQEFDRLSDQSS